MKVNLLSWYDYLNFKIHGNILTTENSEDELEKKEDEPIFKEEGELSDEEDEDSSLRQEPKTVCR